MKKYFFLSVSLFLTSIFMISCSGSFSYSGSFLDGRTGMQAELSGNINKSYTYELKASSKLEISITASGRLKVQIYDPNEKLVYEKTVTDENISEIVDTLANDGKYTFHFTSSELSSASVKCEFVR
ncbi:MAG TPA: hypothetical protein PKH64_12040 [Petrotogaceae bacterium]|nr:hypothetical protein [Petrotogaceae bacterium]HNV06845.1 hypothetical protein [Petrotogaceae bacterium]HPA92957.1 hypothetical protein [Petrotogaceae bacterium]HPO27036.1 hypothetical protein [Petrotogaceae bacterium]